LAIEWPQVLHAAVTRCDAYKSRTSCTYTFADRQGFLEFSHDFFRTAQLLPVPRHPNPTAPLPTFVFTSPNLPFSGTTPNIQLRGVRERCLLPQRVRAEPGRQTVIVAFGAEKSCHWWHKINKQHLF